MTQGIGPRWPVIYTGQRSQSSGKLLVGSVSHQVANLDRVIQEAQAIIDRHNSQQKAPFAMPQIRQQAPMPRAPAPAPAPAPAAPPPAPRPADDQARLPGGQGTQLPSTLPQGEEKPRGFQTTTPQAGNTPIPIMRQNSLGPSPQIAQPQGASQKQDVNSAHAMPPGSPSASAPKRAQERGAFPVVGFAKEQLDVIYKQAAFSAFLYKNEEAGKEEHSASFAQTVQLMQKFAGLKDNLSQFIAQAKAQNEKGVTPEQNSQIRVNLEKTVKELKEIAQQLHEGTQLTEGKNVSKESVLAAAQMTKQRADDLMNKMQSQMEEKLFKFAEKIQKANQAPLGTTPLPITPQQRKEQAANLTAQQQTAKAPPSAATLSAGSIQPPITQQTAERLQQQIPQRIQTAEELVIFTERAQRKELFIPLNIVLVYPLGPKSSDHVTTSKTESKSDGKRQTGTDGFGREKVQEMVLIPGGPSLVRILFPGEEEPETTIMDLPDFLMSVYPVTNAQFASFLNEMHAKKELVLDNGVVYDKHKNVLCKTHAAASTSQIETEASEQQLLFRPLKGMDLHPVVQVSARGAEAYCKAYNFRLPSEAEWEKAAGMPLEFFGEELHYARYGFGKDEIDLSWANFRDELQEYSDNRTTPVGFYNGETVFTKQGKSYQSNLARSPLGCYDMSGNVRQWTRESLDDARIVKGGSYNSFPEELAITASKLLDPNSCFPDTGFRVMFDLS